MTNGSRSFRKRWASDRFRWKTLLVQLWTRCLEHDLTDRASLLSFYFLLAFFPLLLTLSSLVGLVLASQTDTYWRLLDYIFRVMPVSAFTLFAETLTQIRAGASADKISFGLVASFWSASSGFAALIEALNVAFNVENSRKWWQRRLVAMGFTLAVGTLLTLSLAILFATSTAGKLLIKRLPILHILSRFSGAVSALVCGALVVGSLMLIYRFGPNLRGRTHWRGVLPGTAVALAGGFCASTGLRLYLAHFGTLGKSYGSLAGVIALLFWLFAAAAAILVGGELNGLLLNGEAREARSQPVGK